MTRKSKQKEKKEEWSSSGFVEVSNKKWAIIQMENCEREKKGEKEKQEILLNWCSDECIKKK